MSLSASVLGEFSKPRTFQIDVYQGYISGYIEILFVSKKIVPIFGKRK